ncbi:EpsG family protein [Chromobacterium vaccinii]|uniref:EpsG family protein n=1 Tax=Chromobacterium vaccinii TaxID=1108595 RepID=UPI0011AB3A0B|nr:EpsG family protein [Chromobacterium vaccinii]
MALIITLMHELPYFLLLTISGYVGIHSNNFKSTVLSISFLCVAIAFLASGFSRLFLYNDYDDFTQYYQYFTTISSIADAIPYPYADPLFYLLLYFIKLFGVSTPEWLYFSFGMVFILILYICTSRNRNSNSVLFLFLTLLSPFFIIYSGQFVRQSLALCMLMAAISLEGPKKRLLGVLIASGFHFSVLLAIPVIWVEKIKVHKAIKIFFILMMLTYLFPINNNFVSLFSSNDLLFSKVEYWLNDDLEPGSLVFKWMPLFICSVLLTKFTATIFNVKYQTVENEITGFEARIFWLLIYFTIIGFWGRYLNVFSLRFGLWAVIFSAAPIFILRKNLPRTLFSILCILLYIATAINLALNKSPSDFEYIYRYVFFPGLG